MGIDLSRFEEIFRQQIPLFSELKKLLIDLKVAARRRDISRITEITAVLVKTEKQASELEKQMEEMVKAASKELGISASEFKISTLDPDGKYRSSIDELRHLTEEVALEAAEAGGVLSANVEVIEETVKVLESIDARGTGYGAERPSYVSSKIIDRSA